MSEHESTFKILNQAQQESDTSKRQHFCLTKIMDEQFCDVIHQTTYTSEKKVREGERRASFYRAYNFYGMDLFAKRNI